MTTILAVSTIQTDFIVSFQNDSCIIGSEPNLEGFSGVSSGESYWFNNQTGLLSNSFSDCFREDGVTRVGGEPRSTCCPGGYSCNNNHECVVDLIQSCSDYDTKASCEAEDGHPGLAAEELSSIIDDEFPGGCEDYYKDYGDSCYEYLNCRCIWDDSEDTCLPRSNHKVANSSNTIQNWDYNTIPETATSSCNAPSAAQTGECVFSEFVYTGSCLDGDEFITKSWEALFETNAASSSDPSYCQGGSEIITCEKLVRLPFFSLQNLIIAIVLLIIIYYIIIRKKK